MDEKVKQHLLNETAVAKSIANLTPEERRRQMYEELKEVAMECRRKDALEKEKVMDRMRLEALEKEEVKRERMRLEALKKQEVERERMRLEALEKQDVERERMRSEDLEKHKILEDRMKQARIKLDQLKKERLQWKLAVEEEPNRYTFRGLDEEQEKVEPHSLPTVRDKANSKSVTFHLNPSKMKPLYNNWIRENTLESEPVRENTLPGSSDYNLFAAKPCSKSEENLQTVKPKKNLKWMKNKVRQLNDKYRDHRDSKSEESTLTPEEQDRTFRNRYSQPSDDYTEGFSTNRNMKPNF